MRKGGCSASATRDHMPNACTKPAKSSTLTQPKPYARTQAGEDDHAGEHEHERLEDRLVAILVDVELFPEILLHVNFVHLTRCVVAAAAIAAAAVPRVRGCYYQRSRVATLLRTARLRTDSPRVAAVCAAARGGRGGRGAGRNGSGSSTTETAAPVVAAPVPIESSAPLMVEITPLEVTPPVEEPPAAVASVDAAPPSETAPTDGDEPRRRRRRSSAATV